ncbi:MAG: hypothetical protein NC217_02660 [Muribaculaceae bacterium]|nr:hypothetical protein [Muribaculaceae bacterium]
MKTLKYFMMLAAIALMGISMTSCNGYSSKQGEKLADKYSDGEITKDDVAEAIDVYEEYALYVEEELNKLLDKVGKNDKKFTNGLEDLQEKIENKWGGIADIYDMFTDTSIDYEKKEKELGKNNIKRMEKFVDKWGKKFGETIAKKVENKYDEDAVNEYNSFISNCYLPNYVIDYDY